MLLRTISILLIALAPVHSWGQVSPVEPPRDSINPGMIYRTDFNLPFCAPAKDKPTGSYRVFNESGKIWMEGDFRKGRIVTGKVYSYSGSGKLSRIAVYKEGRYMGDTPGDTLALQTGKGVLKCFPDSIRIPKHTPQQVVHVYHPKTRQLLFSGYLDNRCMVTGKEFIYDINGILTRIALYDNGQYTGDAKDEK
jgi:hypothetical protein